MFQNKRSGFSLIEILVAAGLTVIISLALFASVNALTSSRKDALTREKLAILTYDMLNEIENKIENKSTSLGNLFFKSISYPLAYKKNYPNQGDSAVAFCININNKPCLVAYICTKLPNLLTTNSSNDMRGLYFIQKSEEDTELILSNFSTTSNIFDNFLNSDYSISNLIAEDIVDVSIKLANIPLKYEENFSVDDENYHTKCCEQMLRYLDIENPNDFLIYSGKIISNSADQSCYYLQLLDVEVKALDKILHEKYFTLTSDAEKENYIRKHGYQMSRLLQWCI